MSKTLATACVALAALAFTGCAASEPPTEAQLEKTFFATLDDPIYDDPAVHTKALELAHTTCDALEQGTPAAGVFTAADASNQWADEVAHVQYTAVLVYCPEYIELAPQD